MNVSSLFAALKVLLFGILSTPMLQSGANVSLTIPIDAEHTLLLIGGQKANASEIEEYGTNLVYLSSHERLKLAIAGKNNGVWELGDASVDVGEVYARVARVDDHSVVIERKGSDY